MGVREIDRFLERWRLDADDVLRRMYLAPTPRERERWHALWLLARGWTSSDTAEALGRDPHTIGPHSLLKELASSTPSNSLYGASKNRKLPREQIITLIGKVASFSRNAGNTSGPEARHQNGMSRAG